MQKVSIHFVDALFISGSIGGIHHLNIGSISESLGVLC